MSGSDFIIAIRRDRNCGSDRSSASAIHRNSPLAISAALVHCANTDPEFCSLMTSVRSRCRASATSMMTSTMLSLEASSSTMISSTGWVWSKIVSSRSARQCA